MVRTHAFDGMERANPADGSGVHSAVDSLCDVAKEVASSFMNDDDDVVVVAIYINFIVALMGVDAIDAINGADGINQVVFTITADITINVDFNYIKAEAN